ncbi:MAG TPA: DCC1-like thiol-disulfide oxidoreductase family protein [Candidatus Baltobacterales bacterium]|nr:DCC1-like thiol-disulfide oxidoreductase family protein [Candidatus Baltobacterales bacterium]
MARWVRRRDRAGRVLVIPNQSRGALARYGITRAEADRSAWAVDQKGRRHEGAAAVNVVLRELGGAAGALGRSLQLMPLAVVEGAAYRWLARHRSRFGALGVRPECDEPGSDCE